MKFPTRSLNLFLVWILFSLLAIAYIGQRPYLGLAIAIIGGIVLGILSFLYHEPGTASEHEAHPSAEERLDAHEEGDAAIPTPKSTSDSPDSSAKSEVTHAQDA